MTEPCDVNAAKRNSLSRGETAGVEEVGGLGKVGILRQAQDD
ncbi:MAG: hypothetical protein PSX81_04250 [bacterium]|nr:hypothetical protein [bacterium]